MPVSKSQRAGLSYRRERSLEALTEAFREIEVVLASESAAHARLAHLEHARENSLALLEEVTVTCTEGLVDCLRVRSALESSQMLTRRALEVRRELISHRVGLYAALAIADDHIE